MTSENIIKALNRCRFVLENELRKILKTKPNFSASVDLPILGASVKSCGDRVMLNSSDVDFVTRVYINNDGIIMVHYENSYGSSDGSLELFNVGEIADIVDAIGV